MAVLGRLLVGSGERLDLADLLSLDSYVAADFKYLIQSFIGSSKPYILYGLDVINPQDAVQQSDTIAIRVADSIVYYPGSKAGSFYYGLEEGNVNAQPLIPELRKSATNFVYLTFSTFDTAKDNRAFWDPDQNGGEGGEFSQDVNTETALMVEVNVSVSTFPENTIPICKVVLDANQITSIQDCRDHFFRLGTGGVTPDPFSTYTFREEPSATYARLEPPSTMTTALNPNPFQGGDKNIRTLKEWMDVVMTRIKELGGTAYWYQGNSTAGPNVSNVFLDALGSTVKSKGEWQHSGATPGQATWTEDIHYYSLIDSRDLIIRANTINLAATDTVAWIDLSREADFNGIAAPASWLNGVNYLDGAIGTFANLKKGDWVKKIADPNIYFLRVEEFYANPGMAGGVSTAGNAQSIKLSGNYAGVDGSEVGQYTKGEYQLADINVTSRDNALIAAAGGNFFWLAYRTDTSLGLTSITTQILTLTIGDADGQRALVTNIGPHNLVDGDRVYIASGPFMGTHVVEVENASQFSIMTAVTGTSIGVNGFGAIVTTAARSTTEGYPLETANHGFKTGEHITINSTAFAGSYLVNVRSATSFQIAIPTFIPSVGPVSGEVVSLPRLNVRTEFGTVKIVQGETVNIGDMDSENILSFVGMDSLAESQPQYYVPNDSFNNELNGHQNYNSAVTDSLKTRVSRLTAMMADRVQDRGMRIIGRTNIVSVTNGANQDVSALANLTLKKPGSTDLTISLTSPVSIPVNSIALINIDRDGSGSIVPTVESWNSNYLISENKIILFYRFSDSTVYTWDGTAINPSEHFNLHKPEDAQNRNIWAFNPGQVYLDGAGLLTLDVKQVAEITKITTLPAVSVPQSSYFTFSAAFDATNYYVWYNKDTLGVDPALVGKTAIAVAITTGDTAAQVAAASAIAINAIAGADVTAVDLVDVLTITNDAVGPATSAENGPGPSSTTFAITIPTKGFDPDIQIYISGSANNNTIDVDAINTLGTLVINDGQSAWIRVNRFAAKVFNTVAFTDLPDTDIAGKIYVTNYSAIPIDQDVFVLWSRVGNNILETHFGQRPDGNIYDETYVLVPGAPVGDYELTGPIISGTELLIPKDSRDGGNIQEYVVGSGQLELFLNGQYLKTGEDWSEVGTNGSMSRRFIINQSLVVGDYLTFRIDAKGAVYFAASAGGGGTLQDAYDGGRFINVTVGLPITITGTAGTKLLSVQGDMEVTGVIDPAGITFSQQASDPLAASDYGIWRNASDEWIFKRGASAAINLSTDFIRRDGTHTMLANLNLNGNKIVGLAAGAVAGDAVRYEQVLLLSGSTMAGNIAMGGNKLTGLGAGSTAGDSVRYEQVLLLVGGTMTGDIAMSGTQKLTGLAAGSTAGDSVRYEQVLLLAGGTMAGAINMGGTNKITSLAAGTGTGDAVIYDQVLLLSGANAMAANLNMGTSFKIINLANPADPQDAATKYYVDTSGKDKILTLYTNLTGSTILAGTVVVADAVSGRISPANASAIGTCRGTVGVVTTDILTGNTGYVQTAGKATVLGSLTAGSVAYLSTTTGQATTTPPSATGRCLVPLGIAVSATEIELSVQVAKTIDNAYDETYTLVSGAPANPYELTGPITAPSAITLPVDSRNGGASRSYLVGEGILQIFLNGNKLRTGIDWTEVGAPGSTSTSIQIQIDLAVDDYLTFVIPLVGETVVVGGGGGSGSMQDAYDNGRFITILTGQPIDISGPIGEKLAAFHGDIQVDGVVDPKAITFIPLSVSPIASDKAGLWVNTSGQLIHQDGFGGTTNFNSSITAPATVLATLKNMTVDPINKGVPVSIDSEGELSLVDVSNEALSLSLIGVVNANINSGSYGSVVTHGALKGLTTSATFGDVMYVAKDGSLTNVKPTIGVGGFGVGDFVIKVGVIVRDDVTPSNKNLIVTVQVIGQL